jgi:hypothetical protein
MEASLNPMLPSFVFQVFMFQAQLQTRDRLGSHGDFYYLLELSILVKLNQNV